jgi:hypothetical protein
VRSPPPTPDTLTASSTTASSTRASSTTASSTRASSTTASSTTALSTRASSTTAGSSTTAASTTAASTTAAVIACGALALDVRAIARRRSWAIEVVPVDALLHNRPERIAPAVDALRARHDVVALAYADCGTQGALDELGLPRLGGDHCYDVFAGHDRVQQLRDEQPGTYFLTDFLARTFAHTVVRELGLDRHPELRDDYFRHYTRVVWLAQRPTPATRRCAERAAETLGLALEVVATGTDRLERELERLLAAAPSRLVAAGD